jgi:hypothetical protein
VVVVFKKVYLSPVNKIYIIRNDSKLNKSRNGCRKNFASAHRKALKLSTDIAGFFFAFSSRGLA